MRENKSTKSVKKSTYASKFFKVLIILYVLSLITPLAQGYASFPLAIVKCGFKQPYISSSFMNSSTYITPGDGYYNGPDIFTTWEDYHCTANEAEKAGFRDYSWGKERCRHYDDVGYTSCLNGSNGVTAMLPYILLLLLATTLITSARKTETQ